MNFSFLFINGIGQEIRLSLEVRSRGKNCNFLALNILWMVDDSVYLKKHFYKLISGFSPCIQFPFDVNIFIMNQGQVEMMAYKGSL